MQISMKTNYGSIKFCYYDMDVGVFDLRLDVKAKFSLTCTQYNVLIWEGGRL
mgnify:CR=1 FL=1